MHWARCPDFQKTWTPVILQHHLLYYGAIPRALCHRPGPWRPSLGVPSTEALQSPPLCVHFQKSLQTVSVRHRWHRNPKDLRFSTNAHTWVKSPWKWKVRNRPTRNVHVRKCPLHIQSCASTGKDIKVLFIKTTNKDGKFWKITWQSFMTWHNEILFIDSYLGCPRQSGHFYVVRTWDVTSDRDPTQTCLNKRGGYYKR